MHMTNKLLLPNKYKLLGFVLLLIFLALGIAVYLFEFSIPALTVHQRKDRKGIFEVINFTDEIALTGIIVSLFFIAFAREKNEDEFITHTRLESWQWAVLTNYILLMIATWVVHGFHYIDVMMYNMLTILIIFIIRFHYVLYKTRAVKETDPL